MNVLIFFPNNPSAFSISVRLLETGHSVALYCPTQNDLFKTGTLKKELQIVSDEQDVFRGKIDDRFTIHTGQDFEIYSIIGMEILQILPSHWYWSACTTVQSHTDQCATQYYVFAAELLFFQIEGF